VHIEASTHLHRTLQAIKAEGMEAGIALNPHTNVLQVEDVLEEADMVLIMSVNPGFGGQKFIPQALNRIEKLSNIIAKAGTETIIQVDGGVTDANASDLYNAGANCLVAGSYVFKSENPKEAIKRLKQ
jgi:ribulose-phosphate 3-epimerase